MMTCRDCPRNCGVDREKKVGICGVGGKPKLAKAYLHRWEEPCISGEKGSGTVFFSGCNLKCVYCQNFEISSNAFGKEITIEELANIFKELEQSGASNINLVSPSHYVRAIKQAFNIYKPNIPIVYNSSGYEKLETLDMLKDYVDIYLVDFKYMDSKLGKRLSNAQDYPIVAKAAILKMRECQQEEIYEDGFLKKGVIIRHLILPNHIDDSINILKWIKANINNPTVSLMGQYTPMFNAKFYEDINRVLKPIEYKIVSNELVKLGLTEGYLQELTSANECYTPVWDLEGITKKEE